LASADIEKWQAGVVAGAAVLMVILNLFGPAIRALAHLP